MKRRSFVKQSVSSAVLPPLAFSVLINSAGATEGVTENTTVPETADWFTVDSTTDPYMGIPCDGVGINKETCCTVNKINVSKCVKQPDGITIGYCTTKGHPSDDQIRKHCDQNWG